jgi:NADPH-dependent 2,4-dienoyl-CoA reductase/sulfur reductase-like enzyme/Fe-S-cluster-containing hydrogenase component 2
MTRYDLIVVGAGPAGLSAAAEAAARGMSVAVFDENALPGGQLFKQIHKFFGSKEHKARIRGFDIGAELLEEARKLGVEVFLDAVCVGLYQNREVVVRVRDEARHYKGDAVVVATGASENMLTFDGWTLPGVMGAGAAQTMMNVNRVQPGKRVLMLGSGNVGLVVGFQLLQAGCELAAVVDAAPRIGGYGVHAAKLARTGVPFYLSHTIVRAEGTSSVTGVVIARTDADWRVIPGTEKQFDVDTVCIAVGLSASTQLLKIAGCEMAEPAPGAGYLPVCAEDGETSIPGVYAAGDVSGIEEASSAMIEGRIAGAAAANKLGFFPDGELAARRAALEAALTSLRDGMFAPKNRGNTPDKTLEGCSVSQSLLTKGYLEEDEVSAYPGVKSVQGIHPVIECTQNIPCNPCRDACPKKCIRVEGSIVALPSFDENSACTGCGLCVAACSGQSIFLVNEDIGNGMASVTIPYEFLPLPETGELGTALNRAGGAVCPSEVTGVKALPAYDKTALVTFAVPKEFAARARFWKRGALT